MIRGFLKAFPVFPVPEHPVAAQRQFPILIIAAAAWFNLKYILKDTAARQSSGTQQDQLRGTGSIQTGVDRRICQNGLDLRSKQQSALMKHIKQRLHTNAVPGQEQSFPFRFPDGKGEDPVEAVHTPVTVLRVGMEYHFRV